VSDLDTVNHVAEAAVASVAVQLGVQVDPVLIVRLAAMVVGVLTGQKWSLAEAAGEAARAAAMASPASIDAALAEAAKGRQP